MLLMISASKKNVLCLIGSLAIVLSVFVLLRYQWWLFGSLSLFRVWYAHFGVAIWIIKSILASIVALADLVMVGLALFRVGPYLLAKGKTHGQLINGCWVAVIYLSISFNVGEVHPFSTLPMYHRIKDDAFLFYIEDENGATIPLQNVGIIPSAFINKHFDTYLNQNKTSFEALSDNPTELRKVGRYIFDKTIDKGKAEKLGCELIRMRLMHCHIASDSCENIVLYEQAY